MARSVTIDELLRAYSSLYPGDIDAWAKGDTPEGGRAGSEAEGQRLLANWLVRYQETPEEAVSIEFWQGKATRALFRALELEVPDTKKGMLAALGVMTNKNRIQPR